MATHSMYCVGLKRKVDAIVDGVTHMTTSKGSKYQIKGHFVEGGKTHNCTSMCSKAVYEDMKDAGISASVKDRTIILDAEPKLGSGKRFKELSDEIAEEYEEKGKSPEEAQAIGDATAASIGIKKYGKKKMAKLAHDAEGDEEEADVEQPEVDNAYTDESGEEIAPSVVESSSVSATADAPEGSEPLSYDPTSETPMDDGGPAASFSAESFGDGWKCNGCDYEWDAWGEEGTEDGSCPKCGGFSGTPLDAESFSAEAFGGDLASLTDFDGVESVVVEAPLGHGVTQYYAEEDGVVADPSTFPAGSGHVIGSQTADANYTPLHAEDATSADYDPLSETPGPHLDESAPSDSFEAMAVYPSGPGDVNKGMAALLKKVPSPVAKGNFISWGPKYLTVKEGSKHNKYLLFVVFKLENGSFVAGNAYGRIGYGNAKTWFGPQMSSEHGAIREAEKKMRLKEIKKGYNLEFGAEGDTAPEDVNKGMATLLRMVPSQVAKENFISWGPKYLTVKEIHNKYHLFAVLKLDNGMFMPANAYGRIGYSARTWFGPQMSSKHDAIREAEKKMRLKERKKGYNLEFGAEGDTAPEESHPTDYDPLTASPTDEGGPAASFGWSAGDSDAGAFSAEFIANADTMYCAECFESSCGGHKMDAEDGPSPLDYDPLTEAPSGEGGPPAGPSEHFEAEEKCGNCGMSDPIALTYFCDMCYGCESCCECKEAESFEAESSYNMAAGVALVVGLIASYKYSDKISDLFRKLGDE